MATGAQKKRQELKDKRLKAEAAAKGADRRKNLGKIIGIGAFLAVVAVVIVVVVISSGDSSNSPGKGKDGQDVLVGLQQNGNTLGDPNAPVTLVEFGDLQCPVCKQYADDVLPDIITGPVKKGTANFEFENWAILGPDSSFAAKAALAAGEQDKLWSFIEAFYANQGVENSGYVTDDFLTEIANKAGVPDIDKWNEDREDPALEDELTRIDEDATENGFSGTPSFALREADGSLTPLTDTQTPDAIIKAINDAAGKAKSGKNSSKNQ